MAAGDAERRISAHVAKGLQQNRGRAHAVHIIIAVDNDGELPRHGLFDDAHGLFHALHQEGIMQMRHLRIEEALGFFLRIHAAGTQKSAQPKGQIADGLGIPGATLDESEHRSLPFTD